MVLGVPGCVPSKLNCCPIIDFWLCCAAAEAGISLLNAWNHVHVMEMYPKLFSVTLSFIDTGHSAVLLPEPVAIARSILGKSRDDHPLAFLLLSTCQLSTGYCALGPNCPCPFSRWSWSASLSLSSFPGELSCFLLLTSLHLLFIRYQQYKEPSKSLELPVLQGSKEQGSLGCTALFLTPLLHSVQQQCQVNYTNTVLLIHLL